MCRPPPWLLRRSSRLARWQCRTTVGQCPCDHQRNARLLNKYAGAYLAKCVRTELKLGRRVGRIQVCVRVVPIRSRCGADLVNVELNA
eukprot:scaffold16639_cov36-Phaeocystis_antarctica.AAC.2